MPVASTKDKETVEEATLRSLRRGDEFLTRPVLEMLGEDLTPQQAYRLLGKKTTVLKYCLNWFSKPHLREFEFNLKDRCIRWNSQRPNGHGVGCVFFSDMVRLTHGKRSDFFRGKADMSRSLEIVLRGKRPHLCLTFATDSDWRLWTCLLSAGMALVQAHGGFEEAMKYVEREWCVGDVDGDGKLSFQEVVALLNRLNISADEEYARSVFSKFDVDGSGDLDFQEFSEMLSELSTNPVVKQVYEMYRSPRAKAMGLQTDFVRYLMESLGCTEDEAFDEVALLRRLGQAFVVTKSIHRQSGFSANDPLLHPILQQNHGTEEVEENEFEQVEFLTEVGFCQWFCSDRNSVARPDKLRLYMDMSRPLTEYWVNSSHNTYLQGDQLVGASAVGQYIDVLLRGCRCVEMDCWDGPDGEPIVYHGHTLTGKLLFEDIVVACREYGFQKSEFPLIFSLEMHCSPAQQLRCGEILRNVLGDSLWVPSSPNAPLPSPAMLKRKVIIKAKPEKHKDQNVNNSNNISNSACDSEEMERTLDEQVTNALDMFLTTGPERTTAAFTHSGFQARQRQPQVIVPTDNDQLANQTNNNNNNDEGMDRAVRNCLVVANNAAPEANKNTTNTYNNNNVSDTNAYALRSMPTVPNASKQELKEMLQKVYYSIVGLSGEHIELPASSQRGTNAICSLSEFKFNSLQKAKSDHLLLFMREFLARIYPGGHRIASGNFDPVAPWLAGAQLVALNYQSYGTPMVLNTGLFQLNGGCGYVLKPSTLRFPNKLVDLNSPNYFGAEKPIKLTVTIRAGAQLPKPSSDHQTSDILDPFVVITVHGNSKDVATARTANVKDDGFKPVWSKENKFIFDINVPSAAFLSFEVCDHDALTTRHVASYSIPLHAIRTGLRVVPLWDFHFNKLTKSFLIADFQMVEM